ncbi:DNA repair protein XRCC1, partial [Hyposmocoma kahamanoa]|uniref:DNA repair protein XRCC1 n=1 Tax=Hyposmocoma kahamanoa TaxID=1477025 RepID=UPI000E6D7BA1
MPQIKIDYVVSFSSEDSEHPARGLVSGAADGAGRWLCARGQPNASVLLQLARAARISRVTVGAHHAALVEVLAGRSETPHEPFQVLVPSSVFVSAQESRRAEGVQRVRSFDGEQLTAATRDLRFDRVRVVVSQPYNKHCQYGLSFIHLFEPEKDAEAIVGEQAEEATEAGEASDDDEFRPGELFALHRTQHVAHTDTQIRRASALALKNVSDSSTKLVKASVVRAGGAEKQSAERDADKDRRRSASGDERAATPPASIGDTNCGSAACTSRPDRTKRKRPDGGTSHGAAGEKKGRTDESAILRGVVFALSGYANPRRAAVRDLGLRLGARYRPDWGRDCTHLV